MTELAPFCEICRHNHVQGVKCSVCGHAGRANIYKKMRERSCASREIELEHIDFTSGSPELSGLNEICGELRKRIFCSPDNGVPEAVEFSEANRSFNYSVGKVGNAYVFLARWKVVTHDGKILLIIDKCGVLPGYENRGITKRNLGELIHLCASATPELFGVVLYLPECDWLVTKLSMMQQCSVSRYVPDVSSDGDVSSSWKRYVCILSPSSGLNSSSSS